MTVDTAVPVDAQFGVLLGVWLDSLRSVLGQVAGFPVTVEASTDMDFPEGELTKEKPGVWARFTAGNALKGEMAILTSQAGALPLAQVLMSEPPDAAVPFEQGQREGYEELLRQVAGMVSTGLKSPAGGDVELKHTGGDAPSWTNPTRMGIRIAGEKLAPIRLVLVVTAELLASFKAAKKADPPPAPAAAAPAPQAQPVDSRASNLELLLDVDLDATIRFGQKQMLLRDILELHSGVAISLDRKVEEPVELLIGGRMVARGEVVIVDGNYGLRITEILSPQQRLESLGA
jgi:flagellar motor switch protein FliN/FliY